jgi:hypothetical protein
MTARREAGGALVTAVFLTVVALGMVALFLAVTATGTRQMGASRDALNALFLAETGLNEALYEIGRRVDPDGDGLGNLERSFGGGSYAVMATTAGTAYIVRSTGTFGTAARTVEATFEPTIVSALKRAVTALESFEIEGEAFIDSYDSAEGSYLSQVVASYNGRPRAEIAGNVLAGADISVEDRAGIFGDANPGPAGTIEIAPTATVTGSTGNASAGPSVPAPQVPSVASSGRLELSGSTSRTVGPGTQRYDVLTLSDSATLTIKGPAKIVIGGNVTVGGTSRLRIDGKKGGVEIYIYGSYSSSETARVSMAAKRPSDCTIVIVGTGSATHRSAAPFYGSIFANEGRVDLAANADFYGAIVGKKVKLADRARLHFDVDLARRAEALLSLYRIRCWREITAQ